MKQNYFFMKIFVLIIFILPGIVNAQAIKDSILQNYTQQDYENFLRKEKRGEIPKMDGPVPSMRTIGDALVNNNVGSTGTQSFTQSETSILAYGSNVIIGFNDAGSYTGGANKFTGWSYSSDGGTSFTDGGALPTNTVGDAGDPVMARDETTGRIYFSTLGFTGARTIQVFKSDDDGVSWSAPVNGTPGGITEDKQWIVVDNFPGSGNGNVYMISRSFGTPNGIYVYRSTDNGASFGPNGGVNIVAGAQGAYVVVTPDHSVYAFWWAGTTLQMRKSTDFGASFGSAVTVASGLTLTQTNGGLSLTGLRQGLGTYSGFRSSSFPHVAVNPVSGHLYVTFNDQAGADKGNVYMVKSDDGGTTWSARTQINDDATTTDNWQPTIAVTTDGLGVGIFYYSRQGDPTNNNLFTYNGRIGSILGSTVTFAHSIMISDVQSLPEFGRDGVVNSTYMGDYNSASSATATDFHVVWSDNRDNLAGGGDRKDPNVYYKSIPVSSSGVPAQLYGATGSVGATTLLIDHLSGLGTPLAPHGAFGPVTDIQFNPTGSMLIGTTGGGSSNIISIDPITGLETLLSTHQFGALNGLEFVGLVLYGIYFPANSSPADLVIVDPNTGVLTTIGTTGRGSIGGLAYDNNSGIMYGISAENGIPSELLTINLATGLATSIGPVGVATSCRGLAFGPNGALYTGTTHQDTNPGFLLSLNTSTGAGNLIGPSGYPAISGLDFTPDPLPPTPIPISNWAILLGALLIGAFILLRYRRRLA